MTTIRWSISRSERRSRGLRGSPGEEALEEVRDLLWDTALRLEDGNLSLAQARLRHAQQALMDALARDAPNEEIERLMDALKQAMERYLQALAEQALKQAERGEAGLDPDDLNLQEFDLEQMLERGARAEPDGRPRGGPATAVATSGHA